MGMPITLESKKAVQFTNGAESIHFHLHCHNTNVELSNFFFPLRNRKPKREQDNNLVTVLTRMTWGLSASTSTARSNICVGQAADRCDLLESIFVKDIDF
jgi:hypothetical protein